MTPAIHICVVAYALAKPLLDLYTSAMGENVFWHVYMHSTLSHVVEAVDWLADQPRVHIERVGSNRGLATSWNQGLVDAQAAGADVLMIANDDAIASEGDVAKLAAAALEHPDAGIITGMGYDHRANQQMDLSFALCAIPPGALKTIGYFDENYFPIYYEDIDWFYRGKLAGLRRICLRTTQLYHEGSQTLHTYTSHVEHYSTFIANQAYHINKWGGDKGEERYTLPFNCPMFDLRIDAADRHTPYPGYDRDDMGGGL